MRLLSVLFALILIGFAAVQYNDADVWMWASIYGIVAIMCVARAFNKSLVGAYLLCAVAFIASGVLRWPFVDANWLHIEEAREGLGCFIVAIMLITLSIGRPKKRRIF